MGEKITLVLGIAQVIQSIAVHIHLSIYQNGDAQWSAAYLTYAEALSRAA